jgi:hypothetical protein
VCRCRNNNFASGLSCPHTLPASQNTPYAPPSLPDLSAPADTLVALMRVAPARSWVASRAPLQSRLVTFAFCILHFFFERCATLLWQGFACRCAWNVCPWMHGTHQADDVTAHRISHSSYQRSVANSIRRSWWLLYWMHVEVYMGSHGARSMSLHTTTDQRHTPLSAREPC